MDYYGSPAQIDCTTDRPYLHRISSLADEVERSAALVEEFIARCRGGGVADGARGTAPMPSGHFAQLDRLTEAVTKLDKLTRELGVIG